MLSSSEIDEFLLHKLNQIDPRLITYHNIIQVSFLHVPLWSYFILYLVIIIKVFKIWPKVRFINEVKLIVPKEPIRFKSTKEESDKGFTLIDIINNSVPEFKNDALSLFNPFLFNGHAHTMWAGVRKFRRIDKLLFARQILRFPDGGSGSLDQVISQKMYDSVPNVSNDDIPKGQVGTYIGPNTRYYTKSELAKLPSNDAKPIMVALHGLSGSSAEAYVRCLFSRLSSKYGFECFVLNSRGCGNTKLTSPQLFNGFWTEDFRCALKHLQELYPKRPIYASGFSLGGSILANYLGQEGENSQLKLACVVGNPWDLTHSSHVFENDFISSNVYSPVMTVPLKQLLDTHYEELKLSPVFLKSYEENYKKVYKLRDFDDYFTSKLFGFNCASEYYKNGTSMNRIFNIRTPTIILNAEDDPIVGASVNSLPYRETLLNPYLTFICSKLGGHLGWFKWNNVRWYADPLSKLISEFHNKVTARDGIEIVVKKEDLPLRNKVVDGRLPGPFH